VTARRLLWAAIAAYAAGFTALSILRDRAFETARFDLGNMVQAVWNTAHGHLLEITSLQGEQISRLGAHVDPILVVFAPLWWLWPSPDLLLTGQAVAVALGALPVFWLARKHLASERAALGFALVYLLLPAVEWLTLNEFHPVALATPLLLYAFWYLDEDRLVPFALTAVAASLCKEEIALVVAGYGLWYALARLRRRTGLVIAAAGLAWSAFAVEVVLPHFNHGAASSFYARYGEVGGSPGGVLRTAVTHPWELVTTAGTHWQYLLHLGLPLAGLFFLSPLVLVAAVPDLALNLLSKTSTQQSIHFHYTAGLLAPLVVASVLGAARLRRPVTVATVAVGVALVSNFVLGAIPLWRLFPEGETYGSLATRVTPHDRIAERAVALIPSGAVVSSTNSLGAKLSARRRVLSFPTIQDATWIAADETQPGYLDQGLKFAPTAARLARLRRDPAWTLVFEQDGVLVFHRVD
jgi:uncharacterized membrane protein